MSQRTVERTSMSLLFLKAGTAFSGTPTFAPSRGFRPMVAAAASLTSNVGLKVRCELADVVQHAGDPGCLCPSEWLRETGSSLSNGRGVIQQQLPITNRSIRERVCIHA